MKRIIYIFLICVLIVTGVGVFLAKDTLFRPIEKGSNNSGKKEAHTCYVCNKAGDLKYGSYYYCVTHWAMVKTVAEAD